MMSEEQKSQTKETAIDAANTKASDMVDSTFSVSPEVKGKDEELKAGDDSSGYVELESDPENRSSAQSYNSTTDNERQKLTFEEDLWDNLSTITENCRRGSHHLSGLSQFCRSYTKVLTSYAGGLHKCAEQFERDMLKEKGFDTTTIAITNIKQGLDLMVKAIHSKISVFHNDLVEPLELYHKHYAQSAQEIIMQSKTFWANTEEEKKRTASSKDKYYKIMQEVEQSELVIEHALLEHERGNYTIDQVQRTTNQSLNVKYKAELSSQEYKKDLEFYNLQLSKFNDVYQPLLQKLQQGEESRINFLKYNFEKLVKHFGAYGKAVADQSQDMSATIAMINSDTDLKIFIDEHRSYEKFVTKEDFKPYEVVRKKQIQQLSSGPKKNPSEHNPFSHADDGEQQKLIEHLQTLLVGADISFDEKSDIIRSLHDKDVRDSVASFLQDIRSPRQIETHEALKTLGELLKYLLTAYVHDKDQSVRVIYAILSTSQMVHHIKSDEKGVKTKIYLTHYLNDHGIWQEQNVWKTCIQKVINQKFHEASRSQSLQGRMSGGQSSTYTSAATGFIGHSFGKLKGAFWGKAQDDNSPSMEDNDGQSQQQVRIQKSLAQNIIFNSLSKFLFHFVNFQLSFEPARDIVLHFCEKYELDSTRTHLLLSELESTQRKQRFVLSERDMRQISLQKRSRRVTHYGMGVTLIAALSLKYIDGDQSLANILQVNKEFCSKLTKAVYKQALLLSQPERLQAKRIQIWSFLLQLKQNNRDYGAFRDKIIQNSAMISNVEEVIDMDVQRSFTNMKSLDPQILSNILKTYAFFNPEIEYCQGMNFIAGFLYLTFNDEETAFKALQELIDRYDMAELFNSDLPKLKLFFYQLDRLVSIQLPLLHSHFKDEMINSSYYASPWFITLFSNALQLQDEGRPCERLLQLWDYFLVSGWKSIFMMGISVLQEHEDQLLAMSFEGILNFITDKPKHSLSQHVTPGSPEPSMYNQLRQCNRKMKGSRYLLERLEQEFKDSLEAANQNQPPPQSRVLYKDDLAQQEEEKKGSKKRQKAGKTAIGFKNPLSVGGNKAPIVKKVVAPPQSVPTTTTTSLMQVISQADEAWEKLE